MKSSAVKISPKQLSFIKKNVPKTMQQNVILLKLGLDAAAVSKITGSSKSNISRDKWAHDNKHKAPVVSILTEIKKIK